MIGFDSTEYTVEASASEVLVGVSILSGQLSRSLSVSLQTADDSAVGKSFSSLFSRFLVNFTNFTKCVLFYSSY